MLARIDNDDEGVKIGRQRTDLLVRHCNPPSPDSAPPVLSRSRRSRSDFYAVFHTVRMCGNKKKRVTVCDILREGFYGRVWSYGCLDVCGQRIGSSDKKKERRRRKQRKILPKYTQRATHTHTQNRFDYHVLQRMRTVPARDLFMTAILTVCMYVYAWEQSEKYGPSFPHVLLTCSFPSFWSNSTRKHIRWVSCCSAFPLALAFLS